MDTAIKLEGIVRSIEASVQIPGLPEHKFMLNMDFSNCTVEDVIVLSMSPRRIGWANSNRAKGEAHLVGLDANQTITVQPVGTRGPIDIEAAYMAKANTFDEAKLDAEIKRLEAMKTKTVLRKAKAEK